MPSAFNTPPKKQGAVKRSLYTQNGKATAQHNITKATKINMVLTSCVNKVASLLKGRKVTFQKQVKK